MVMMAETNANAPYDVLRPLRCRRSLGSGRYCNAKTDTNIDWSKPGLYDWKCKSCNSNNVVYIPEATSADESTGPL